eukprot:TRINITY_DN16049_c0_g1_i1.p2 TRINITY_DN16049_c0_g1~~TRINITY_DN16049_c0_g1_i1.p2  ORF type:complete len:142 (-),score=14.31 TRINITY_DN16049_c0_g1_i1:406-831(-)
MGTVDLLPTFKYSDIFTSHEVVIDINSINRYCLSDGEFIVGFDYQEKRQNKLSTRYTTILPQIPLFPHLLILIFAPDVRILADQLSNGKHSRYDKLIYDNNELSFDYFLTKESVSEVNSIRNLLRKLLSQELTYATPDNEI